MDKLRDEEGTQCRPAAPDVASKYLEDDRTPWEPQRPERAEGNIVKKEWKEALLVHEDSDSRQRQYTDSVRLTPPRAARGRSSFRRSRRGRRQCVSAETAQAWKTTVWLQVTETGRSYTRVIMSRCAD